MEPQWKWQEKGRLPAQDAAPGTTRAQISVRWWQQGIITTLFCSHQCAQVCAEHNSITIVHFPLHILHHAFPNKTTSWSFCSKVSCLFVFLLELLQLWGRETKKGKCQASLIFRLINIERVWHLTICSLVAASSVDATTFGGDGCTDTMNT